MQFSSSLLFYTHCYKDRVQTVAKYFVALFDVESSDAARRTILAKKLCAEVQERDNEHYIPKILMKISNDFYRLPSQSEAENHNKLRSKVQKNKKVSPAADKNRNKDQQVEEVKVGKNHENDDKKNLSIESLADLEKSDNTRCIVCFDSKQDAVYLTCGHGGVCYKCAQEVFKVKGECLLCRNKIKKLLKIEPIEAFNDRVKVVEVIRISDLNKS